LTGVLRVKELKIKGKYFSKIGTDKNRWGQNGRMRPLLAAGMVAGVAMGEPVAAQNS
jgi:hypothetical protein